MIVIADRGTRGNAVMDRDAPQGIVTAAAETIRRALIDAAEAAYEDAGIQGLCAEGRWEAAVSAMRGVDVTAVARGAVEASISNEFPPSSGRSTPPESAASV